MGKKASDSIDTRSEKLVPTVHQQFFVLHLGLSKGYATVLTQNQKIGQTYGQ